MDCCELCGLLLDTNMRNKNHVDKNLCLYCVDESGKPLANNEIRFSIIEFWKNRIDIDNAQKIGSIHDSSLEESN